MATETNLTLTQGDDPQVSITVTRAGAAFSLVGRRVELLVKADRLTADSDQLYRLSSVTGGITITNAAGGLAVADFTNRLAAAGQVWYRAWTSLTADDATDRQTFAYGLLTINSA